MSSKLTYETETYAILGACFEVYKQIGSGFLEAVYQECLEIEFTERSIPFVAQPSLRLKYKNNTLDQSYHPDFTCFDKIILEIKAVKTLADENRAQTINYLKATNIQVGLLVNFGTHPKVQHERFVNQTSLISA